MFLDEKTQGEATPIKTGTLKLSEAMRIGARMHPQCVGGDYYEKNGCTCAFGAAAYGAGFSRERDMVIGPFLDEHFGRDITFRATDAGVHVHWENAAGVSREEIADRLEAIGL